MLDNPDPPQAPEPSADTFDFPFLRNPLVNIARDDPGYDARTDAVNDPDDRDQDMAYPQYGTTTIHSNQFRFIQD